MLSLGQRFSSQCLPRRGLNLTQSLELSKSTHGRHPLFPPDLNIVQTKTLACLKMIQIDICEQSHSCCFFVFFTLTTLASCCRPISFCLYVCILFIDSVNTQICVKMRCTNFSIYENKCLLRSGMYLHTTLNANMYQQGTQGWKIKPQMEFVGLRALDIGVGLIMSLDC